MRREFEPVPHDGPLLTQFLKNHGTHKQWVEGVKRAEEPIRAVLEQRYGSIWDGIMTSYAVVGSTFSVYPENQDIDSKIWITETLILLGYEDKTVGRLRGRENEVIDVLIKAGALNHDLVLRSPKTIKTYLRTLFSLGVFWNQGEKIPGENLGKSPSEQIYGKPSDPETIFKMSPLLQALADEKMDNEVREAEIDKYTQIRESELVERTGIKLDWEALEIPVMTAKSQAIFRPEILKKPGSVLAMVKSFILVGFELDSPKDMHYMVLDIANTMQSKYSLFNPTTVQSDEGKIRVLAYIWGLAQTGSAYAEAARLKERGETVDFGKITDQIWTGGNLPDSFRDFINGLNI